MRKHLLPALVVLGFPAVVCIIVIVTSLMQEAK